MPSDKYSIGPALRNEVARRVIWARQQGRDSRVLDSELDHVGSGQAWKPKNADGAVMKLADLQAELLADDRSDVNDQLFDRAACKILHRELNISPNLAASDGFWRWLAVEKFCDVIEARHSRRSSVARLMNFGIDGPPTSNRLRILWLRADIVYDACNEDPYHLATRRSPTDFWESGIIRHRYGWSRNLARLMARFQYPDPDSGMGTLHLTHENGIRMLYKRLKRMHSTIAFEYLEDSELLDILKAKSADLLRVGL